MACTIDLRFLDEGFGGKTYKRKREQEALINTATTTADASMEIDAPPAKRSAIPSTDNPEKPVAVGKPTYDGVIAGKVSGRNWKQPRKHRASAKQENILRTGTKLQKITNPKTLKKISKSRDRKMLKMDSLPRAAPSKRIFSLFNNDIARAIFEKGE
ncbi:hypothetical protein DKX38_003494 [Salix brachista]|uniref:Coiled-coil domain-containing protein 86 n=1 Tax=Salix brachista TaxID=2182728 RepID=A0A5N5NSM8_9ROSI|nr:hypothetical protein DKX38_003494 [Salix brachista]